MITNDTKLKVIQLKQSGMTYSQISEQLGISKGSISTIIKEAGLGVSKPVEITEELLGKIQERYNEIGNIKKVAEEFHISYRRLAKIKSFSRKTKSNYEYVKDSRVKKKLVLVEYKGGKCERCGYSKCIHALEFHHLNPLEKDFNISSSSKPIEELKKEVDKCQLLCANCHREVHQEIT